MFKNGVGGVALVVLESELEEGTSRVALRIKPKNGTEFENSVNLVAI